MNIGSKARIKVPTPDHGVIVGYTKYDTGVELMLLKQELANGDTMEAWLPITMLEELN